MSTKRTVYQLNPFLSSGQAYCYWASRDKSPNLQNLSIRLHQCVLKPRLFDNKCRLKPSDGICSVWQSRRLMRQNVWRLRPS
ncbi:hypothetical protein ETT05_00500 [Neisseria gonorrhoeae]